MVCGKKGFGVSWWCVGEVIECGEDGGVGVARDKERES